MANIGTLSVSVVAETGKFNKNIKGARGEIKSFSSLLRGAITPITAFGAAITGIGGIGIVSTLRSSADAIDSLAKASDKLGIATDKLAGLQHAADLSGVSVSLFNKGLQQMVRQVSDASRGTGEGAEALKLLGINAQQLNALSPDKQFLAIAAAMESIALQGDRVSIAMDLFGRSGGDMLNVLSEGESGLASMTREAERLGLAVSREEAAKVEAYNDAVSRLQKAVGGFGNQIIIDIAPRAEEFVTGLTEAVTGLRIIAGEADKQTGGNLAKANKMAWDSSSLGMASRAAGFVADRTIARMGPQSTTFTAEEQAAMEERHALMRGRFSSGGGWEAVDAARKAAEESVTVVNEVTSLIIEREEAVNSMIQDSMSAVSDGIDQMIKQEANEVGKEFRARQREKDQAEKQAAKEAMKARADSLIDSIKSPMDRFKDLVAETQQLRTEGELTKEQQQAILSRGAQGLLPTDMTPQRLAPLKALEFGTTEAFTAARQNLTPKLENETKKQTEVLTEIRDVLKEGGAGDITLKIGDGD